MADDSEVRLQPLVRRRIASLGVDGERWVAGLPGLLEELCEQWDLRLESSLAGGSASYVVAASTSAGERRVLKVAVPGLPLTDEARLLRAAAGRGYVVMHAHDPERDALLLESLGASLERTPMPVEDKLDLVVDTLRDAWEVRPQELLGLDDPSSPSGAAKALALEELCLDLDARFPGACDPAVLERALDCAENRAGDLAAPRVVVHGDPHPPNVLRVERLRRGAGSGWVLVDPDGFVCDPAYDLGVLLREWHARLDGQDPARARDLLRRWCHRVAERAGLGAAGAERTWEWAYLERVSTGLYVTGFGARELGEKFLRSARMLL